MKTELIAMRLELAVTDYRAILAQKDSVTDEMVRIRRRLRLLAELVRLEGGVCALPWE